MLGLEQETNLVQLKNRALFDNPVINLDDSDEFPPLE